jgi:hypothetical protein
VSYEAISQSSQTHHCALVTVLQRGTELFEWYLQLEPCAFPYECVCIFVCMLGVVCAFLMKEPGMCIKFCFILTETTLETYKILSTILTNSSAADWVPVISPYPENGDEVSVVNIDVFQCADVAVSPRGFYWILSLQKLQD